MKYNYEGKSYEETWGVYKNDNCKRCSVKGFFYVSEPLKPKTNYNTSYFLADPEFVFSFSDGRYTYSSVDPYTEKTHDGDFEFTLTTGDDAMPEFWFISLRRLAPPHDIISSKMSTGKDAGPASFDHAEAERQQGEDTQQRGEGKVKSEGIWTASAFTPPSGFKIVSE